jgi:putative oxidoreductase
MKHVKKFWGHCKRWGNKHSGQLVLRVVLGGFFLAHGVLKFSDMENTVAFFTSPSVGVPAFLAYFVSGVEVVGGIALMLGVFTCTFGTLLAVIQLVAIYKVTARIPAPSALIAFAMGYGMNLVLAAAALSVAFTGPGRMSLFKGRCCVNCRHDRDCSDCDTCGDCGKCSVDAGSDHENSARGGHTDDNEA